MRRELLTPQPTHPLLMMSDDPDRKVREAELGMGANDYIEKPNGIDPFM